MRKKDNNNIYDERFIRIHFNRTRDLNGEISVQTFIVVDRMTGVNYLLVCNYTGDAGGMTVLVDADGKPIVTPEYILP